MTGKRRPNAGNLRFAGVLFFCRARLRSEKTPAAFQLDFPGVDGLAAHDNRLQQNRPDE
jgi:hypothetical protein